MREIVSIHVGEAGVRMGEVIWDVLMKKPNSSMCRETVVSGTYTPRAVFVDLDSSTLEKIPYVCVSGREDASNNFARGYCTVGRTVMGALWDHISHMVEACESMQGILLTHSTSGGTGAGLGSLLGEKLDDEFPRISKIGFQLVPSPQVCTTIVEPYNTSLCHHYMMDKVQTKILMENEALYDLCMLQQEIERPTYHDLNSLVANVVTSIVHQPCNEYYTNLVPYPRIHYVTCSYAPMRVTDRSHANVTSVFDTPSPYGITRDVLQLKNRMIKVYGKPGKWIAAYVMYNGQITTTEINKALQRYRDGAKIPFVDWSPVGIKCSLEREEGKPMAATLLVNDTVIKESFRRNNERFNRMWSKGAFVHWYLQEGMETGEFIEAQENLAALELDYKEMELESKNSLESFTS
jgi:tubulin alpha